MRSNLLGGFCRRFPTRDKQGRASLKSSEIVALVFGMYYSDPVDGASTPDDPEVINWWLHLGAFDLQPREFEAHVLQPSESTPRIGFSESPDEVEFVGTWDFFDSWHFARALGAAKRWYLRFFIVADSSRRLGAIRPSRCIVRELQPRPADNDHWWQWWDGPADIEKAKRSEERRLAKLAREAVAEGRL